MSHSQKVAVLLCGYGKVEAYDDFADYNERALRLLASKFIKFPDFTIPWIAKGLEMLDRREWSRQHNFQSPHNEIFHAQRQALEEALQRRYGDRVQVFTAFNFCDSYLPHQVLATIREQGFEKLVIFPLLVVDSIYTNGLALQQINEALGEDTDWLKDLRYLPSFGHRPEYHQRLADHIEARLATLRTNCATSQVGIVLMNHGCPMDNKGFEGGIRDSEELYRSVRDRLIDRYPLISIGWMNHQTPGQWTTPDIDLAAQNLLTLGARALVFVPIGFVTENHETMLDVAYSINKLRSKVECLHVDCLNDDRGFLEMCAGWLDPLIADLADVPTRDAAEIPTILPPAGALPNRNQDVCDRLAPQLQQAHSHHGHSHQGHSHHGHSHHHHHH
ncbi:MAG: ferrochelatase [Synechococcus sp.]